MLSVSRLARRALPRALPSLRGVATESFLGGTSATYVEEMFAAYKKNPARCAPPTRPPTPPPFH